MLDVQSDACRQIVQWIVWLAAAFVMLFMVMLSACLSWLLLVLLMWLVMFRLHIIFVSLVVLVR